MVFTGTYVTGQIEYLQQKVDTINNAASNKESVVAWKTVKEMENYTKAKLKVSS